MTYTYDPYDQQHHDFPPDEYEYCPDCDEYIPIVDWEFHHVKHDSDTINKEEE